MVRRHLLKFTAFFTAGILLLTETGAAQVPAPAATIRLPAMDMKKFEVPEGAGTVERFHWNEDSPYFMIFIQDAHGIQDAQWNIHRMIQHIQTHYRVNLVALEGGAGRMDPTLLRAFPDAFVKEKTLHSYVERGELSGAELAALLNEGDAVFLGLEDWEIYEQNHWLYLQAIRARIPGLEALSRLRGRLDQERSRIYTEELNAFHRETRAFEEEQISLMELLGWLSPRLEGIETFETRFPSLTPLLKSVNEQENEGGEDISQAVARLAQSFKADFESRLPIEKRKEFNRAHQEFATGRSDAASFLRALVPIAGGQGIELRLSARMKDLMREAETLSMLRGTRVFDELTVLMNQVQTSLMTTPEQKELAGAYQNLRQMEQLFKLELDRSGWEQMGALLEESLSAPAETRKNFKIPPQIESWLAASSGLLKPAMEYYRVARQRDLIFHRNLVSAMVREKARAAVVLAGGFHTAGLEALARKEGHSYAVVTPKIRSLDGKATYEPVMRGELSYRDFLEDSFYDAFARHASLKLVQGLDQPSFLRSLKYWRDEIIRSLARQGRLGDAGRYTRYVDLLYRQYYEKYGHGVKFSSGPEELARALEKDLEKLRVQTVEGLRSQFGLDSNPAAVSAGRFLVNTPRVALMPQAAAKLYLAMAKNNGQIAVIPAAAREVMGRAIQRVAQGMAPAGVSSAVVSAAGEAVADAVRFAESAPGEITPLLDEEAAAQALYRSLEKSFPGESAAVARGLLANGELSTALAKRPSEAGVLPRSELRSEEAAAHSALVETLGSLLEKGEFDKFIEDLKYLEIIRGQDYRDGESFLNYLRNELGILEGLEDLAASEPFRSNPETMTNIVSGMVRYGFYETILDWGLLTDDNTRGILDALIQSPQELSRIQDLFSFKTLDQFVRVPLRHLKEYLEYEGSRMDGQGPLEERLAKFASAYELIHRRFLGRLEDPEAARKIKTRLNRIIENSGRDFQILPSDRLVLRNFRYRRSGEHKDVFRLVFQVTRGGEDVGEFEIVLAQKIPAIQRGPAGIERTATGYIRNEEVDFLEQVNQSRNFSGREVPVLVSVFYEDDDSSRGVEALFEEFIEGTDFLDYVVDHPEESQRLSVETARLFFDLYDDRSGNAPTDIHQENIMIRDAGKTPVLVDPGYIVRQEFAHFFARVLYNFFRTRGPPQEKDQARIRALLGLFQDPAIRPNGLRELADILDYFKSIEPIAENNPVYERWDNYWDLENDAARQRMLSEPFIDPLTDREIEGVKDPVSGKYIQPVYQISSLGGYILSRPLLNEVIGQVEEILGKSPADPGRFELRADSLESGTREQPRSRRSELRSLEEKRIENIQSKLRAAELYLQQALYALDPAWDLAPMIGKLRQAGSEIRALEQAERLIDAESKREILDRMREINPELNEAEAEKEWDKTFGAEGINPVGWIEFLMSHGQTAAVLYHLFETSEQIRGRVEAGQLDTAWARMLRVSDIIDRISDLMLGARGLLVGERTPEAAEQKDQIDKFENGWNSASGAFTDAFSLLEGTYNLDKGAEPVVPLEGYSVRYVRYNENADTAVLNVTVPDQAPEAGPAVMEASDTDGWIALGPELEMGISYFQPDYLQVKFRNRSELRTAVLKPISTALSEKILDETRIHGRSVNGRRLTVNDLSRFGMEPRFELEIEGEKIWFSGNVYTVSGGRLATIAYIRKDNVFVPRSYYISGSQAYLRYLVAVEVRDEGLGWYHKGRGEGSLSLPYPTQIAFSELLQSGSIVNIPNRLERRLLFAGTTREEEDDRYLMTYFEQVESRPVLLNPKLIYEPEQGGIPPPQSVGFADPGDAPDFGNTVALYSMTTDVYGEIKAKVFKSKNQKWFFVFMEDKRGRVWIGNIETTAKIGPAGLRETWVNGGPFTIPAYEYDSQAGQYGNFSDAKYGYVDMFQNYLRKVPVIREYRKLFLGIEEKEEEPAEEKPDSPAASPRPANLQALPQPGQGPADVGAFLRQWDERRKAAPRKEEAAAEEPGDPLRGRRLEDSDPQMAAEWRLSDRLLKAGQNDRWLQIQSFMLRIAGDRGPVVAPSLMLQVQQGILRGPEPVQTKGPLALFLLDHKPVSQGQGDGLSSLSAHYYGYLLGDYQSALAFIKADRGEAKAFYLEPLKRLLDFAQDRLALLNETFVLDVLQETYKNRLGEMIEGLDAYLAAPDEEIENRIEGPAKALRDQLQVMLEALDTENLIRYASQGDMLFHLQELLYLSGLFLMAEQSAAVLDQAEFYEDLEAQALVRGARELHAALRDFDPADVSRAADLAAQFEQMRFVSRSNFPTVTPEGFEDFEKSLKRLAEIAEENPGDAALMSLWNGAAADYRYASGALDRLEADKNPASGKLADYFRDIPQALGPPPFESGIEAVRDWLDLARRHFIVLRLFISESLQEDTPVFGADTPFFGISTWQLAEYAEAAADARSELRASDDASKVQETIKAAFGFVRERAGGLDEIAETGVIEFGRKLGAKQFKEDSPLAPDYILGALSPSTWRTIAEVRRETARNRYYEPEVPLDAAMQEVAADTETFTGPGIYYAEKFMHAENNRYGIDSFARGAFVHEQLEIEADRSGLVDPKLKTLLNDHHPAVLEGHLRFASLLGGSEIENARALIAKKIELLQEKLESNRKLAGEIRDELKKRADGGQTDEVTADSLLGMMLGSIGGTMSLQDLFVDELEEKLQETLEFETAILRFIPGLNELLDRSREEAFTAESQDLWDQSARPELRTDSLESAAEVELFRPAALELLASDVAGLPPDQSRENLAARLQGLDEGLGALNAVSVEAVAEAEDAQAALMLAFSNQFADAVRMSAAGIPQRTFFEQHFRTGRYIEHVQSSLLRSLFGLEAAARAQNLKELTPQAVDMLGRISALAEKGLLQRAAARLKKTVPGFSDLPAEVFDDLLEKARALVLDAKLLASKEDAGRHESFIKQLEAISRKHHIILSVEKGGPFEDTAREIQKHLGISRVSILTRGMGKPHPLGSVSRVHLTNGFYAEVTEGLLAVPEYLEEADLEDSAMLVREAYARSPAVGYEAGFLAVSLLIFGTPYFMNWLEKSPSFGGREMTDDVFNRMVDFVNNLAEALRIEELIDSAA